MLTQNRLEEDSLPSNGSTFDLQRRKTQYKGKGLSQILQKLRKNSQQLITQQTKMLKHRRKRAETEQKRVYYKDIQQQVMKPGDAVLRTFSQSKPLNIGDIFLDTKQKAKIIFSQRIYTKMPNVVSGTYQKRVQTQTQGQQKEWMNRKFSDYDRIVTQQTGPLRIFLKKRSQAHNGIKTKHQINIGKNENYKQLFSAFDYSKNDFYKSSSLKQTATTKFTNSSSTYKQSTRQNTFESQLSSKVLLKEKIKKMSQNIIIDINNRKKRISTNFV